MTLHFALAAVSLTEFGVGREDESGSTFVAVPVDAGVQGALQEMVSATWKAMQSEESDDPGALYEASEKHAAKEYLTLPADDAFASTLTALFAAGHLDVDSGALADPTTIFCYFTRMVDGEGRRLTAVRRATQFKGILRSQGRLVRVVDDTLQVVDDTIFKLDSDFDLLIDAHQVHILRPAAFESLGQLQKAILAAVPDNMIALKKALPFAELSQVEAYAAKHPRAARYLASIISEGKAEGVDKKAVKQLCMDTGVSVQASKGFLAITPGHEMGFLEVLDRRRYEVELVPGTPERFRAASRKPISG